MQQTTKDVLEFEKWVKTRPEVIQTLARAYPPGEYKIAEGAPYGYTCPGTIVSIEAYNEKGTIRVAVAPENVRPEAIDHAQGIRREFTVPNYPISAQVEPQYLIPLNS